AGSKILIMWEQLLQAFEESCTDTHTFTGFLEQGQKALRYYYDILVFQETYYDGRLEAMEKIVIGVLNSVKLMKNINLPINCAYVLARMLVSAQKNTSSLHQWEQDHQKEIQRCLKKMAENMSNEYILTESIARQLHSNINMRLSEMNRIFLMLNINFYNRDIRSQDTVGIILSHGYSTASSIADAANSLLNSYTFEAIDMPLNTPVQEISGKLNDFIEENPHLKNIILLVDMGSLEGIGEVIADSVNVGVINNISTSLALNIGMKIQQHYELEELLETACAENQCNYKVLSEAKKEKAIVFTNDAGMVISEKLCRLFKESLPRPIDLKMISYEFDELMKNRAEDILFHRYDVVLMIKPYSLKLKKINSVTLEDIMNFENIEQLNQVFRPYLSEEEIEEFDRQLLKNFSMQSVMENITILNADKLLDYVSDSVSALQHTMGRKFQSKTIVGIYIHICFLVERLVTKTALEKYSDLSSFEEQHEEFIADVNRSFEVMLQHYHVKLPISEIAYLFEYIENDVRKAGGEDEF
ncbi:MAG: PRD domain-containing protein, partial [[Clostridium] innocuum]